MNTRKIIGVVSTVAVVFLAAPIAFAEEGGAIPSLTGERSALKPKPLATTTRAIRDAAMEKKQAVQSEAKAKIEAQREEAKAHIEAIREEAKARIEAVREEAKTRIEAKREEVKQRLSDIRDKAKQQRAERIAELFDTLNRKWTDHFIALLSHYDTIVQKIQDRANIAADAGKGVATTTAAIQSATTAIETARIAVIAQAAKTYTLDTSTTTTTTATTTASGQDELVNNLRTAFQAMHKSLFGDLKALRDGVMKSARAAVKDALQALREIPRVDDDSDSADDSTQ